MSDSRLETLLTDLGERMEVPQPPDLITRAMADPRITRATRRRWPRALAAAVALAVVVTVSVPSTRDAVAAWFGIGATTITVVDDLPTPVTPESTIEGSTAPSTSVSGSDADRLPTPVVPEPTIDGSSVPGTSVSGSDADDLTPFSILWPDTEPVSVIIETDTADPIVTMVMGDGGVITQMASIGAPQIEKSILSGTDVSDVEIDGVVGVWIDEPHVITYLDSVGTVRELPPRAVGSTLLFEHAGLTVRIETPTLAEAIEVARQLID